MKHLILPLTLIGILIGCTKEKPIDPTEPIPPIDTTTHIIELGKGSVLRNGLSWNATFSAQYYANNKNRFLLKAKVKENGFDHTFSIKDISTTLGVQNIENPYFNNASNGVPNVYYFVYLDLDQEINTYNVDTTRFNQYLELLHYDSIEHIVEGRFQTFLEGPTSWLFLPDSMAMTEGRFHLKIQ